MERDLTNQLCVIVFRWVGWRPVTDPRPVHALDKMVAAHLSIPHRFVCVTDNPDGMKCETFPCWEDPIVKNQPTHHASWRRLKMFSEWAARQWPGWVLMLDLDVVITGDITPLITWEDFRILKGAVSRYRGGMWLHRTGTRTHVWDTFDPDKSPWEIPKYTTKGKPWVGSDQGWLSVTCPGERTYSARDGVYVLPASATKAKPLPEDARIIFTMGDIKPWQEKAKETMPAVWNEYRKWI